MTPVALTERRAADRKTMADAVEKLILACGATCTRLEGGGYPGPRAIQLDLVAPGGLELSVDFDGDSCQPDVYVLSWHMGLHATLRLNNATFGGDVNACHQRKATYIARGFDDLCTQLKAGLLMAQDGTAYLPEAASAAPPAFA
jgi:hypothetical protein